MPFGHSVFSDNNVNSSPSTLYGLASSASASSARGSKPPHPGPTMKKRSASALNASRPADSSGPWTRRSASWSREEDERLAALVEKEERTATSITPTKMWSRVAQQLTNRTGKQCRERWLNQLKPGIRRGSWSPEEERILHEAHAELGNKWVAIAERLPGRTDNCVKNHWNSMLRKRQRREAALRAAAAAAELASANAPIGIGPGLFSNESLRRTIAERSQGRVILPNALAPLQMSTLNPGIYQSSTGFVPADSTRGIPSFSRSGSDAPVSSSPITPQRSAKLQISNLLLSSGNGADVYRETEVMQGTQGNLPPMTNDHALSSHRNQTHNFSPQGAMVNPRIMPSCDVPPPNPAFQSQPSFSFSPAFNNCESYPWLGAVTPVKTPEDSQGGHYPGCITPVSPVGQTAAAVGNNRFQDGVVWTSSADQGQSRNRNYLREASDYSHSYEEVGEEGKRKRLRRSTRLAALERSDNPTVRFSRDSEKNASKQSGNALAALAAAASSVPPSPLTPESRYSYTSHSRSVSPSPSTGRHGAASTSEESPVREAVTHNLVSSQKGFIGLDVGHSQAIPRLAPRANPPSSQLDTCVAYQDVSLTKSEKQERIEAPTDSTAQEQTSLVAVPFKQNLQKKNQA